MKQNTYIQLAQPVNDRKTLEGFLPNIPSDRELIARVIAHRMRSHLALWFWKDSHSQCQELPNDDTFRRHAFNVYHVNIEFKYLAIRFVASGHGKRQFIYSIRIEGAN